MTSEKNGLYYQPTRPCTKPRNCRPLYHHVLQTTVQGDRLPARMESTKQRLFVETVELAQVEGPVRTITGEKGPTLRSWYLFWPKPKNHWNKDLPDNGNNSVAFYVMLNALYAIPTIGISLVVMVADVANLPFRLRVLTPQGEVQKKVSEVKRNRTMRPEPIPSPSYLVECNGFMLNGTNSGDLGPLVADVVRVIPQPWYLRCRAVGVGGEVRSWRLHFTRATTLPRGSQDWLRRWRMNQRSRPVIRSSITFAQKSRPPLQNSSYEAPLFARGPFHRKNCAVSAVFLPSTKTDDSDQPTLCASAGLTSVGFAGILPATIHWMDAAFALVASAGVRSVPWLRKGGPAPRA